MTREEILYNIEQLEMKLVMLEDYFDSLPDEKLVNIEDTREYAVMKKIIIKLNALNSALENCV